MVAYHFPPLAGSSGIQRTLRFVQHLPAFGWQPLVLTAQSRAYSRCSPDLDHEVSGDCVVKRSFALDTARHLAFKGRYVAALARPDRWISWKFGALWDGMRLIKDFQPDIIWSTYPIATAHLIGAELARRSGLPWVADFRDPMAQNGYPADQKTWQQFTDIEKCAMQQAKLNIFTTPGAARMYCERYPEALKRITVIENGYDEESFSKSIIKIDSPLNFGSITLLHSGIVYPSERDPTNLFLALGILKRSGRLVSGQFKLRFRAAVHNNLINELASKNDVYDLIETMPPLPYREALQEMLQADALLIMQGSGCNEQVPAKIYEYMRCAKPIIGLTDLRGDTAGVLRSAGINAIANLASADDIVQKLPEFIAAVRTGEAAIASPATIADASRYGRSNILANHFDALAKEFSDAY